MNLNYIERPCLQTNTNRKMNEHTALPSFFKKVTAQTGKEINHGKLSGSLFCLNGKPCFICVSILSSHWVPLLLEEDVVNVSGMEGWKEGPQLRAGQRHRKVEPRIPRGTRRCAGRRGCVEGGKSHVKGQNNNYGKGGETRIMPLRHPFPSTNVLKSYLKILFAFRLNERKPYWFL